MRVNLYHAVETLYKKLNLSFSGAHRIYVRSCHTSEIDEYGIPVIEALATRHTVRQVSGSSSVTGVTLESGYSFHTLTLSAERITL